MYECHICIIEAVVFLSFLSLHCCFTSYCSLAAKRRAAARASTRSGQSVKKEINTIQLIIQTVKSTCVTAKLTQQSGFTIMDKSNGTHNPRENQFRHRRCVLHTPQAQKALNFQNKKIIVAIQ